MIAGKPFPPFAALAIPVRWTCSRPQHSKRRPPPRLAALAELTTMATESDTDRADHLLRVMHPVFSHDLPNQMVAMQGLLQLIEQHVSFQSGPEGREYFKRLTRVAGRAANMVQFLKEVGRLDTYERRVDEISLAKVVRQIQLELHQQMHPTAVDCILSGDVATVRVDARLLSLAIVEIARSLAERRAIASGTLFITGQRGDKGPRLAVQLSWSEPPATSRPHVRPEPLDNRLEIVLARELLAAWGAKLANLQEELAESKFTIVLPPESLDD